MEILKKDMVKATSLEDFILFGAIKDTKTVFGQAFVMQTLSSGFLGNIAVETSGLDVIARDYIWKVRVLAHAIKSVNGNPLISEDPDDKEPKEKQLERVIAVLRKWERFVLEEAYAKYEELMKEQKTFADEIRKKYQKETPQS